LKVFQKSCEKTRAATPKSPVISHLLPVVPLSPLLQMKQPFVVEQQFSFCGCGTGLVDTGLILSSPH